MNVTRRIMYVFLLFLAASGAALAQTPPVEAWGVNSAGQIWQSSGGQWASIDGALTHVSVASDGSVWGVNSAGKVYRRAASQWQQVSDAPPLTQISVGKANDVWGLDSEDKIFRWDGAAWTTVGGLLASISVAADGSVWGVNRQGVIFRRSGQDWQAVEGRLVQISAARANDIWGVNASNDVWRWNGSGWALVGGRKLTQVAAGADGSVWGLDVDGSIVRREGDQWQVVPGGLVQVAVANPGNMVISLNQNLNIQAPPVVVAQPNIYIAPPTQQILIQGTTSIDVTPASSPTSPPPATGSKLVISGGPVVAPTLGFNIGPVGNSVATCGTSSSGRLCRPGPATFAQNASIVCPSGTFPDVGKWSCWSCPANFQRWLAGVDTDKACQQSDPGQRGDYLAATFRGRICPSGSFFDPIRGGECYQCPEGYKRSAAHIDAPNACYVPAGESLKAATKSKSTIWPHECGSGTFWDGKNGGGCWSCPGGYNRTAYAVDASNACSAVVAEKQAKSTMFVKAACGPGEFYDFKISGNQDISAGGGCWTCPTATDRTVLAVDSNQACQRAPGLRFARATQAKALTCEASEIFDPINSNNSNMSAALRERNAQPGSTPVMAATSGGTCWTCPPGSKRTVDTVYGGAACQPSGIEWKPTAYNQPGLFGLKGAEAVALKLVKERTTINSVIAGMKEGPEGNNLAPDFARVTWDLIASSPQDSAVLQAAVFSRIVAAANDRAGASPEELALLDDVITQIKKFRIFMAQDALDAYRAWLDGTTFRQGQYARSQLQTLTDTGEVPPDFEDITLETILGSLAASHGANAAVVATLTSDKVFRQLFPFAQRVAFKATPRAGQIAGRIAAKTVQQTVKVVAEGAKAAGQAAGGMTATIASIGPQIIITIGIEILAVAIEQQIDIANAEPKLKMGVANANNAVIDFKRLMATSEGNSQAQGYWANLMAGPAKTSNTTPAAPKPLNLAAFATEAQAAKAAL